MESHHKLYGFSSNNIPPVTITISPAGVPCRSNRSFLSLRIRDQGGGVSRANMAKIFSYGFTTAGHGTGGAENGGGPYAAQRIGGIGEGSSDESNMFGDITGKGLQTSVGTIAGLGYGLPMSRLYAACVYLFLYEFHSDFV